MILLDVPDELATLLALGLMASAIWVWFIVRIVVMLRAQRLAELLMRERLARYYARARQG
jgi:hypothetical protein